MDATNVGVVSADTKKEPGNDKPFWDISITDGTGDLEEDLGRLQLVGGPVPPRPLTLGDLKFRGPPWGKVSEFREQTQYNFNDVYYVDRYPPTTSAFPSVRRGDGDSQR